ncbi:MAG: thioredoxin family protein [Acidimicrobiales bacterium]
MKVALLYFDGCPSWQDTARHLAVLAAELGNVDITHRRVHSPEEAERTAFRGSPSVIIDGVDPFAEPTTPCGFACRLYQTPDGPAGSPTIGQLRAVMTTGR